MNIGCPFSDKLGRVDDAALRFTYSPGVGNLVQVQAGFRDGRDRLAYVFVSTFTSYAGGKYCDAGGKYRLFIHESLDRDFMKGRMIKYGEVDGYSIFPKDYDQIEVEQCRERGLKEKLLYHLAQGIAEDIDKEIL